jgi:hypothetical protein
MSAFFAFGLLACTGGAAAPGDDDPADSGVVNTDTSDTDTSDTDPADTDMLDTDDPADTAAAFCDGVPTLAYTNFGEGFLRENCQGCHASTAPDRYDAPEDVFFDTVEDAWAWSARILARSTGDDPSMPPQGGVTADDRTRLEWWLRCGTPGT